jgi:hypothetical protein
MEHYAGMVPEALESLSSEERRRVYMLLKLTVALHADGTLEASGALGGAAPVCDLATLSPVTLCGRIFVYELPPTVHEIAPADDTLRRGGRPQGLR